MARITVYLGIDLGTSGVRVEAYSEDGRQLYLGRSTIASQEPSTWLNALAESIGGVKLENWAVKASVDSTSGSFASSRLAEGRFPTLS